MNKYTKITASIGPKCEDKETLTRMISAGVNMCRLNFSHDTGDVQGRKIDMIREISNELNTPVAVTTSLSPRTLLLLLCRSICARKSQNCYLHSLCSAKVIIRW